MFDTTVVRHWLRRFKRHRQPRPLAPNDADLRLVQRTRGSLAPKWVQYRRIEKILSRGERQTLRASLAVAFLSVGWLLAVVVGQHRVVAPAVGGRYVEGAVGTPELVNPIFASFSDVDTDLTRLVYSGLMRHDEKGRLVPDLAASVAISDDKKTYTFELRRDAVWHDGEKFTAHDVVFTIETIQNPAVGSPLLPTFQGVDVAVTDQYTVTFTLPESFSPFLSSLTVGILPEHIWGTVSPERIRLHKYNLQPIGSGPYLFHKLLKDDTGYIYRYELIRHDAYYRPPAYIAEFAMQFFGGYDGPNSIIQALREQKIQGMSFVPYDLKDQVERKRIVLHTLSLPQYTALFFNQSHASLLKEARLRQALGLALDKDRIVRQALQNDGQVIDSPFLTAFVPPGLAVSTTKGAYSIDEANALLDGMSTRVPSDEYFALRRSALVEEIMAASSSTAAFAGAASSTDAAIQTAIEGRLKEELQAAQTFYRKGKDGAVMALQIVTADTPEYKHVAELIAGSWQEIGIKTAVELIPPKDIPRRALKGRDYDVLLYGIIVGSDPDQYPFWHSSQIDFPGLNVSGYASRIVDELLTKARAASDPKEQAELYGKIQEQIVADRPAIFLYTPTYTFATTDEVRGIESALIYQPADRFNTVTSWYIETKSEWGL